MNLVTPEHENFANEAVLIGRNIDHALLRKQLEACVAEDAGLGFG